MSRHQYPQYFAIALSLTFLVAAMPSEAGRYSDEVVRAHAKSNQQQLGGTRSNGTAVGGGRGSDRMRTINKSTNETAEFAVMEATEGAVVKRNKRKHSHGGRGPDHPRW